MSTAITPPQQAPLLREPNFRWLLIGSVISMMGDQFTLIALPWLVLRMTGDTVALGAVLALMGVPRAVFILVGGAVVDRHSPQRVLMITKYVNTLLLGVLGALVLGGTATLRAVYALALAIGLSTAFSIPSGSAMLPMAVRPQQLQAANGMMLGLRQLTFFIGPLLAGLMIALSGGGSEAAAAAGKIPDASGLGLAFLFDAASFAVTIWTLARVRVQWQAPARQAQRHVLHSVAEGLRYCWNDVALRTCFLYWSAIVFFIHGPIQVAIPVLSQQLGSGAGSYGALMGAHGGGTLLGMVISGVHPKAKVRRLGLTILVADATVALLFLPMGLITATWQGNLLMLLAGATGGYVHVAIFTWMQQRVPPRMMGRTMSIFMFIFMGIGPVSAAIAGWVMRSISTSQLFFGSGAMLLAIVALALVASPLRGITMAPKAQSSA